MIQVKGFLNGLLKGIYEGLIRVLKKGVWDLVCSFFNGRTRIITPIRIPFRVLISLLITCVLSPPTLSKQVPSRV